MSRAESRSDGVMTTCFQFRHRTLDSLRVTIAVAVAGGRLRTKLEQKRQQREAVEAIVKLGGSVTYDYERADASPTGPDWLRKLPLFKA